MLTENSRQSCLKGGDGASWSARKRRGCLEVLYGNEEERNQYAALHLHSSYFRLVPGPEAAWGTSVVLVPTLWRQGAVGPDQGAGVKSLVAELEEDVFVVTFSATVARVRTQVQVRLHPPRGNSISANVEVQTAGDVRLETGRPWDMCKPVLLSSMWKEPDRWDASTAWIGEQQVPLPPAAWFLHPPRIASRFGLLGGRSRWQAQRKVGPAPNVTITLAETLPVTGWVTSEKTVRDDNLGMWAMCDHLPRAWAYRIDADLDSPPPP